MQSNKLSITAFPRIHITLIGMNDTGYRINGGIGFSLKLPAITANISISNTFSINDTRIKNLDKSEIARINKIINSIIEEWNFSYNINVVLSGNIPTHSGFGTGTMIRLLCIESLFILNRAKYTNDLIINYSKRGGTSGIGVNTYFNGGFVFDIGHKKTRLVPSSIAESDAHRPLTIYSGKIPTWEIGLCFPDFIKSLSSEEEQMFFKNTLPVKQINVNTVLYESVYGALAGVIENDKITFISAINKIQNCHWKKYERKCYGNRIIKIEKELYAAGASCVGMSSLGPTLFFLGDEMDDIIAKFKNSLSGKMCTLIKTKTNNKGRLIHKC